MPKFMLACQVTVSAYTVVEAADLNEAVHIAEGRDVGFAGTGTDDDEVWLIEEADGSPRHIHLVEG